MPSHTKCRPCVGYVIVVLIVAYIYLYGFTPSIHSTIRENVVYNDNARIDTAMATISNLTISKPRNVLRINGLKIDELIENDGLNCADNHEPALIIDTFLLHSILETHLIALRIYELCEYVDLFIIVEVMYYSNGGRRNESIFEKYKNETLKMVDFKCNDISKKIIHHKMYRNIFVEGQLLGYEGDELTVLYWLTMAHHYMIGIAFEECFKYFGDSKCNTANMHNIYVIFSDTDEIPRYNVLKLIKKCGNKLKYPIAFSTEFIAYDFGCYLNTSGSKEKIVRLSHIASDVRQTDPTYLRLLDRKENYTQIDYTHIENGGWHLTFFGDSHDLVSKNLERGHAKSRRGYNLNEIYAKCIVEVCGWTVRALRPATTYRSKTVNKNDTYYPLMVQHSDNLQYISSFLLQRINIDDSLYASWSNYTTHSKKTDPNTYCKKLTKNKQSL